MPGFLARIELHGGSDADYKTLHTNMATEGFLRSLTFGGVGYELPPATYFNGNPGVTVDTALQKVISAATKTKYPPDPNDKAGTKVTPGTSAIAVFEAPKGKQAGLKRT